MSSSALAVSLRNLRGRLAAQHNNEEKDEHLLDAFLNRRDDSAFAALVRRHGPMVLHVCRRVLSHEQDAEDAFQSAFLVLAQSASTLRNKTKVASFLHGIAYRTAMKAKQAAARRRKHEGKAPVPTQATPADELSWREVKALLDEEITRLPEIYRVVFVLFYLEDLSREETARRLGLKDATVAKRLAAARQRLSQRLARRGVELSAVLAAAAVAAPPASALPAGLMAKTMKAVLAAASGKELAGVISASVAELVQGAATMLIGNKAKIATMLLLIVATSGSLVGWLGRASGPLAATTTLSDDKPTTAPSKPDTTKTVMILGRVVDPDGNPVKDARLHWPHFNKKDPPRPFDSLELVELGRSSDEGRYRITLPAGEDLHDTLRTLVVTAAGYGLNWVELSKGKPTENVTVRLCKDVPIRGRILSMEGRPLAGVNIRVETLQEMQGERLDRYLAYWEQDWNKVFGLKDRSLMVPLTQSALRSTTTDRNGCFQISGAGSERIVNLAIRGKGIAHAVLPIVARVNFDPAALNKSVRTRAAMMPPVPGLTPVLYGPSFEFIASPERIVEGVVRSAGSGKPIPGVRIHALSGYRLNIEAISDKDGRYHLEGLPKMKRYPFLSAFPPPSSPWLPSDIQGKEAGEGLQPVQVDFTLGRGVVLTGRVIDRTTGKGVVSSYTFNYLPDNKFAGKSGYNLTHHSFQTEPDGHFRVKVVPGTGVLEAHASEPVNPFLSAEFSADDRKHVTLTPDGDFTTFEGGIGFLKMYNTVKWFDLAPDAGVVEHNLYLERGATVKVQMQDPQGKPLKGVMVSGIDAIPGQHYQKAYVSPHSECSIVALDPDQPRQVIFYHAQRRLVGSLIVRGDEKEPLTVRLMPTGTLTGRARDAEGNPLQGGEVEIWANDPSSSASINYLYLNLNRTRLPVRTDKEGRFRLEGVVPDEKFSFTISRRGMFLNRYSSSKQFQVKAGQTLDLGDILIKP